MFNSTNPAKAMRNLQLMGIAAAAMLISLLIGVTIFAQGWSSVMGGNILFGLSFWLASGVVAGLLLGKMNSVVLIANQERSPLRDNALDDLIISLSCHSLGDGRVVQAQIANLFAGAIGVAVVYAICQGIFAITGVQEFGTYPGTLLGLIPLCTAWKVVENYSTNLIMRGYQQRKTLR